MDELQPEPGKRAAQAAARNAAIAAAAWKLAGERIWPSPASVSKRLGISVSVVEREHHRLDDGRRRWEKLEKRAHPQWRDPKKAPASAGADASPPSDADAAGNDEAPANEAASEAEAAAQRAQAEREGRARSRASATMKALRKRVAVLEELNRRMQLGIRPAEIQSILDAGTPQRSADEPK